MEQPKKCLAVVRVRGVSDIFREVKETMSLLHLERNCHATLIDNRPSYLGMLHKGEVEFHRLPNMKPIFRLHPPSKGFKGKVKRSFASGGVTGNQGEAINSLLEQMI